MGDSEYEGVDTVVFEVRTGASVLHTGENISSTGACYRTIVRYTLGAGGGPIRTICLAYSVPTERIER